VAILEASACSLLFSASALPLSGRKPCKEKFTYSVICLQLEPQSCEEQPLLKPAIICTQDQNSMNCAVQRKTRKDSQHVPMWYQAVLSHYFENICFGWTHLQENFLWTDSLAFQQCS